jgi:hypothetical protein
LADKQNTSVYVLIRFKMEMMTMAGPGRIPSRMPHRADYLTRGH